MSIIHCFRNSSHHVLHDFRFSLDTVAANLMLFFDTFDLKYFLLIPVESFGFRTVSLEDRYPMLYGVYEFIDIFLNNLLQAKYVIHPNALCSKSRLLLS